MPFKTLIERPHPKELVRDPDLQLSLRQLTDLANQAPTVRLPIVSAVVAPKLSARLKAESLKDLEPDFQNEVLALTSEYLLQVLSLPILGERAALKKHVQKFLKMAQKMQPILDKESYTVLISGLTAGSSFNVAATQIFNLTEALKVAIASSDNSVKVLGSTQRSVEENCRLNFALALANTFDRRQLEIHADSKSPYVQVLRACLHTIHFGPDEDGTDVLRTARNAIAKRQTVSKRSSSKKAKQR